DSTTASGSNRSTSIVCSDTVEVDGSTIHTAGCWLLWVSAVAGMSMTELEAASMRPTTVVPRRMAAGGSFRPTLTSKVRVTGSAWGATSRTRPVTVTAGSSFSDTVTSGFFGADRIAGAGTSKTASLAPWRASVTIMRPAETTSPGSAPTEVMTPAASALSSVKAIWSSANLTCASADSTWDCAVWNDSRA